MSHPQIAARFGLSAAAFLFCVSAVCAQQAQQSQPPASQQTPSKEGAAAAGQQQPAPPKIDPAEEAAYKEIYDTPDTDADKVIQLGEAFVQKYPTGKYTSEVYGRLVNAYLTKNELDKMYAAGDKAISLNPDNVNALVTVGWVIPHYYDPNDMDADRKLDKAERYLKHAIEVFGTMPKPPQMTDDQFAKAKAGGLSQAHSGLGLVYFRRNDSADSITELETAEKLASTPDPTDFYILGMDYDAEKKYTEAADAFNKCAAQPGGLVGACKQGAEQAKQSAAGQPK